MLILDRGDETFDFYFRKETTALLCDRDICRAGRCGDVYRIVQTRGVLARYIRPQSERAAVEQQCFFVTIQQPRDRQLDLIEVQTIEISNIDIRIRNRRRGVSFCER